MMGEEYTIADMAIFPWVRNLVGFYGAGSWSGHRTYHDVNRGTARPSSPARPSSAAWRSRTDLRIAWPPGAR